MRFAPLIVDRHELDQLCVDPTAGGRGVTPYRCHLRGVQAVALSRRNAQSRVRRVAALMLQSLPNATAASLSAA